MSRPTSRLLAFLELLQGNRVLSARDAAERLGVTERTIRRYSVTLYDLGIPVDGQAGAGGGYRLQPGMRLPPLMLDDEEATAATYGLVLAAQRGFGAAHGALAKLQRVLPERLRRSVEYLYDEVALSDEPGGAPAASEILMRAAEAVRRRRSLAITYTDRAGVGSTRTIDPYGVVARAGRWYVPALDGASGEMRTFRADRIQQATLGGPASRPPEGFDAARYVVQTIARMPSTWRVVATIDVPPDDLAWRLPRTWGELEPDGGGTRLTLRADSLEWAAGALAGLGVPFRLVEPEELRPHLAALADVLARSADPTSSRI
jgi:predicted DNA-binding transcriptional regulator YafY